MIEEPFAKGTSRVHRIDPRVKILCALFLSIIIAVTHKIPVAASGLATGIFLIFIARLYLKQVVQRLFFANIFILLLWTVLPFSLPGAPAFSVFGLTATIEGIRYTLLVTLKCNGILLLNIALISTSRIFDLVHAMRHFRAPDKLIHIFFFLFRYVNVVAVEYSALRRTLAVRGFHPATSIHTYRTYGSVIGTLLVRGHDRSEQIHKAMVCRGFKGKYWLLDHFSFSMQDALAAVVMGVVIVGFGVLQWTTIVS